MNIILFFTIILSWVYSKKMAEDLRKRSYDPNKNINIDDYKKDKKILKDLIADKLSLMFTHVPYIELIINNKKISSDIIQITNKGIFLINVIFIEGDIDGDINGNIFIERKSFSKKEIKNPLIYNKEDINEILKNLNLLGLNNVPVYNVLFLEIEGINKINEKNLTDEAIIVCSLNDLDKLNLLPNCLSDENVDRLVNQFDLYEN